MKYKYLLRTFVLVAILLTSIGVAQPAYAQPGKFDTIIRDLTYWNAVYTGYVDATTFEKWPMILDATYDFEITVTPTSGDLVPLVRFLDQNSVELVSGVGSLVTTQPAGNYFIQVEPQSGSGFYELTIRQVNLAPTVTTEVTPGTIFVDESAIVTVSLSNIPAEGYTSAEFTCTYPLGVVAISNITLTDLFGADLASATNDPQDGSFIVAMAGSNGQRAMLDGIAFSFTATGLQAGQAVIECTARASIGDSQLTDLTSIGTTLIVNEVVILDGTLVGQVLASKPVLISLYAPDASLFTSVLANLDGTFSIDAPPATYTVTAEASGFLSAEGPAVLTEGATTTMTTISLLAGDIDGNSVIDQFDAMTIGMSYNTATPDAADLNADGVINVLDLELLAANYRATGPQSW
jgi:hypothetical protein